jgi:hypothetical protein
MAVLAGHELIQESCTFRLASAPGPSSGPSEPGPQAPCCLVQMVVSAIREQQTSPNGTVQSWDRCESRSGFVFPLRVVAVDVAARCRLRWVGGASRLGSPFTSYGSRNGVW